mmetsp:Transcript_29076/g.50850  ORF Transcript_29076/g.50850 Transcript_29076/m.50850 type:complete len:359 (+) Transcript_29076:86-1162(+)
MALILFQAALMASFAGALAVVPRKPFNPASAAISHHSGTRRIAPPLDPKSHQKFFKKDYPRDKNPGVSKDFKFKHPYPVVQETHTFAKDYVKDDNGDGGKWQAQMTYDVLRQKIKKERVEAQTAQKKVGAEHAELEEAAAKKKKAEIKAAEAEKRAEEARKEAKKAKEEAAKAEQTTQKVESEMKAEEKAETEKRQAKKHKEVTEAKEKVEKEMTDLAACKAELEAAKAKLKLALEANEKQHKVDGEKLTAAEKSLAEANKGKEVAEKAEKVAEAEKTELKTQEEKLEKEISAQKAEHDKAELAYKVQQKKLEQTEAELAAAEKKLHGEPAAQPKSGTSRLLATPLLALALSAVAYAA